jgi:DNA-binding XRE family transcriptional regulator
MQRYAAIFCRVCKNVSIFVQDLTIYVQHIGFYYNNFLDMTLGYKLKAIRESKNISREQMAEGLNLSLNTYKKIEYGEKIPTIDGNKNHRKHPQH